LRTARRRHPNLSRRHGGSKIGSWWTHELVGYALDCFHRQYLRAPTQREIRAGIDELPSYATIRRLYGSLGAMLRFHGYRVRPRGRQPGRSHDQAAGATARTTGRGDPSFGRAVRQLRHQRQLSQERLSLRSQLHRNYISGIERGDISPSLRAIKHLADGLEIRPSQLLAAAERLDVA
jgi:hypothetical protein